MSGEIKLNENYWDCECKENYIHKKSEETHCIKCGAYANDQPDSRENEVMALLGQPLSGNLAKEIYANIREEITFIKEKAGDIVSEAVKNVNGQIDHEALFDVKMECSLISVQLELLDKLKISNDVRDIEAEKEFREWAFVIEDG